MRTKTLEEQATAAKAIFPFHRRIRLRIKENPCNPFQSPTMEKFILTRETYPEYQAYFHDEYVSIHYENTSISVQLPYSDKLWIELSSVFDVVPLE